MRRIVILSSLLLCNCNGDSADGLSIVIRAETAIIDDSFQHRSLHDVSFVGGDGEATIFWSDGQPDGSEVVFARDVTMDLDTGELERVSTEPRRSRAPAACRAPDGLAVSWSDGPVELPIGITLNEGDVMAVMAWPTSDDETIVHPNTIGLQSFPSMACLGNGDRIVAYNNVCTAVDHTPDGSFLFRPEECETEPESGHYLGFFDSNGDPAHEPIRFGQGVWYWPGIASAGEDRFVAISGTRVQSWRDRELLDEFEDESVWSSDAALACVHSQCAIAGDGNLLIFDAGDLPSRRTIVFQATSEPSVDERIFARAPRLACDPKGVCVVTWVLDHETWHSDYVETETLGVFAAAFDLDRAVLGDTIGIRDPWTSESGALPASTGPGQFLLASPTDTSLVVQRLSVE